MSIGSAIIDGLLIGATSLAIASVSRAQDLPEPPRVCTKTACYPLGPYDSRNVLERLFASTDVAFPTGRFVSSGGTIMFLETGPTLVIPLPDAPNVLVSITITSPETFLLPSLPRLREPMTSVRISSKPEIPVFDLVSPKSIKPRDVFVEGPTLSVDRSPRGPVRPERKRESIRGDEVAILPNNRVLQRALREMQRTGSNGILIPQPGGGGPNPSTRFNPRRHAVNR